MRRADKVVVDQDTVGTNAEQKVATLLGNRQIPGGNIVEYGGIVSTRFVDGVPAEVTAEQVEIISGPAIEVVIPCLTNKRIAPGTAVELVVSCAANQHVVAGVAVQQVVAVFAPENIIPGTAIEDVVSGTTIEVIVAGPAIERVVTCPTVERVVTAFAVDDVVAATAVDHVITAPSDEEIVARSTGDRLRGAADGLSDDVRDGTDRSANRAGNIADRRSDHAGEDHLGGSSDTVRDRRTRARNSFGNARWRSHRVGDIADHIADGTGDIRNGRPDGTRKNALRDIADDVRNARRSPPDSFGGSLIGYAVHDTADLVDRARDERGDAENVIDVVERVQCIQECCECVHNSGGSLRIDNKRSAACSLPAAPDKEGLRFPSLSLSKTPEFKPRPKTRLRQKNKTIRNFPLPD